MNPEEVYVKFASDPMYLHFDFGAHSLCTRPNVVYTSKSVRKIKVIVYIYIRFNQTTDKKPYINAYTEAVKHLHAVVLLTSKQRK